MRSPVAIIESAAIDIEAIAHHLSVEVAGEADDLRIAEHHATLAKRHSEQETSARKSAQARRLRIGALLAKARPAWPERGPKAKGWGEYLKRFGISDDSALRYIAEYHGGFPQNPNLRETPDEVGERDVKPENAIDAPTLSLVPDPPPEVEIDRDTWCTPKWITDAIGRFDLDPCSNSRSTVQARHVFDLAEGALMDGLKPPSVVEPDMRVFINPPYSDVGPWITAYAHTRFCFLLKLDTSTRWFADLHARTELILIPRKRVNFEPPPGVPPEKAIAQQFPHALFYAHATDATPAIRELSWEWRLTH